MGAIGAARFEVARKLGMRPRAVNRKPLALYGVIAGPDPAIHPLLNALLSMDAWVKPGRARA
jgi:hypothetical protein